MLFQALVAASFASVLAPAQRDVDIVVMVADDLAAHDVEEIHTPNIDRLASMGLTFTRAYSMPLCAASRSTAFFGTYLVDHYRGACLGPSVPSSAPIFPASTLSMADAALAGGRRTAHFGKWHLGRATGADTPGTGQNAQWMAAPLGHGYLEYRVTSPSSLEICNQVGYYRWKGANRAPGSPPGVMFSTDYHTEAVRDETIAFLEEPSAAAKFAWVSFAAPHTPFHSPPAPHAVSDDASDREKYEAAVRAMDAAIGDIVQAVDLTRTWLLFISDNGTPPAVAPIPERAKLSTFERGVRVPWILAGPDVPIGVETDSLVHWIDLYATVQDLSGLHTTGDGRSILPIVRDPKAEIRDHVFVAQRGRRGEDDYDRAVITKRHKLRIDDLNGTIQLFDLVRDPEERSPIPPRTHPRLWAQMQALMVRYADL